MNREAIASAIHAIPHETDHPEGQGFRIGDVVKIVNPRSWFAKRDAGKLFRVEYSYFQKYGWMGANERDKRQYSLKHIPSGVTSSWYDECELMACGADEWPDVIRD